jgi:hypothetical protein
MYTAHFVTSIVVEDKIVYTIYIFISANYHATYLNIIFKIYIIISIIYALAISSKLSRKLKITIQVTTESHKDKIKYRNITMALMNRFAIYA